MAAAVVDVDLSLVQSWATGAAVPLTLSAWSSWTANGTTISPAAASFVASAEQRSTAWCNMREAFVTGSVLAKKVGLGYVSQNGNARDQVVSEFLYDYTGTRDTALRDACCSNENTIFGTENEWLGREMYCMFMGSPAIKLVNLLVCPGKGLSHIAASPDALVNDDGLLEVKLSKKWDFKYARPSWLPQVMTQMKVTQRWWCDIAMGYMPDGPNVTDPNQDRSKLTVARVEYSVPYWETLEDAVSLYCRNVMNARLTGRVGDYIDQFDILSHDTMPTLSIHQVACIYKPVSTYWNTIAVMD